MIVDTYKVCPVGHINLKWKGKKTWYCKDCDNIYFSDELVTKTDYWEEKDDRINSKET